MKNFPESYGSIDVRDLIIMVLHIEGKEAAEQAIKDVKAGPNYVSRMEDFYEKCYQKGILPVYRYFN